jgi:hypothetical protein
VDGRAESQPKTFSAFHGHGAFFALFHRGAAKGIGHKESIVAVVPPTRAEIGRVGHQGEANRPAIQRASTAPLGGFAQVFWRSSIGAAGDEAAIFSVMAVAARAKAHLFLVAESEVRSENVASHTGSQAL